MGNGEMNSRRDASVTGATDAIPPDANKEAQGDDGARDEAHPGRRRGVHDEGEKYGEGKDEAADDLCAERGKEGRSVAGAPQRADRPCSHGPGTSRHRRHAGHSC